MWSFRAFVKDRSAAREKIRHARYHIIHGIHSHTDKLVHREIKPPHICPHHNFTHPSRPSETSASLPLMTTIPHVCLHYHFTLPLHQSAQPQSRGMQALITLSRRLNTKSPATFPPQQLIVAGSLRCSFDTLSCSCILLHTSFPRGHTLLK